MIFAEEKPSTLQEMQKSQILRAWDVFMLGPVMIYIGQKRLKGWEKNFTVLAGVLTILYNGRNYLQNQKNLRYFISDNENS